MLPDDPRDGDLEAVCDAYEAAWRGGEPPDLRTSLTEGGWTPDAGDQRLVHELPAIDLEHRWRRKLPLPGAERLPAADDYVSFFDGDPAAPLPEWVVAERDARLAAGEADPEADLRSRYASLPELLAALARSGQSVTAPSHADSNDGALRVRCPHCQNPIELLADTELESIGCPSCGSDFSLVGECAATSKTAQAKSRVGHFELLERVGVGSFGAVWKARDTKLQRTVAVKIPRKGQLDATREKTFLREAQNAAQLAHPNVVPVYEVGRDDETIYLVSEFIDGLTLADWLAGQHPTPREAARIGVPIAEALQHAHDRGVIHRDLKPGNVMLDDRLCPRLMDFGLAKRDATEITMTVHGQILGTPAYMSPEQAAGDGKDADARSDVYSLGVILFELLTGELPFRGNTRMLLHQVLNDDPPSPKQLNARIPKDLETITLKCLEKDPRRRYPTAREVADDLGRFLADERVAARPPSYAYLLKKAFRRHRTPIVAAATILFLLVGGVLSTSVQAIRATEAKALAVERKNEALWSRYAATQYRLQDAWRQRDYGHLERILETLKPEPGESDYRGWEWYFYRARCDAAAKTIPGRLPSWSPTGDTLAIVRDKRVVLCRPGSDTPDRVLASLTSEQELNEVHSLLRWSDDGSRLAVGAANGEAIVFDVSTGERLFLHNVHDQFRDIEHDSAEEERLHGYKHMSVRALDLNRDGSLLVTANTYGVVQLWDVATGRRSRTVYHPERLSNAGSLRFHPDGRELLASLRYGQLRSWDLQDGTSRDYERVHDTNGTVAWSIDGARFVCSERLAVYRREDESPVRKLDRKRVGRVAWIDDSRLAASSAHVVSVLDADSLEAERHFRVLDVPAHDLSVSASGRYIAVTDNQTTKVIDLVSEIAPVTRLPADQAVEGGMVDMQLQLSPDGRLLATAEIVQVAPHDYRSWMRIWNTETRELIDSRGVFFARDLRWSGDGGTLTYPTRDNKVNRYDIETGETSCAPLELGISKYTPISANGRWVVYQDGQCGYLRDLSTNEVVGTLPDYGDAWLGEWNHADNAVALGVVTSLAVLKPFDNDLAFHGGHGHGWIRGLAWTPDDSAIVASTATGHVYCVDATTYRELRNYDGHTDAVNGVGVSPDGTRLASASNDGSVRVWDFETAAELLSFEHPDRLGFHAACWSPDGQRLIAADGRGEVFIWSCRSTPD